MSTTPDTNQPADDSYTGLPEWVKWTLLAFLAVILVLVLAAVIVGGDHGPGRHMSAPDPTAVTSLLQGR